MNPPTSSLLAVANHPIHCCSLWRIFTSIITVENEHIYIQEQFSLQTVDYLNRDMALFTKKVLSAAASNMR